MPEAVPTLDYRPRRERRWHIGRKAVGGAVVLLLVVVGGWLLLRPRPRPPTYYPRDRFLKLGNVAGWTVVKGPAIPGPYAHLGGAQSAVGEGVSGSFSSQAGQRVTFDLPGKPDTSLLVVGVANPSGQLGTFVLYRSEPAKFRTRGEAAP